MRFLIIGCNGMAGHLISIYLKESGHTVTGYARERSQFVDTIMGDAADFDLLKRTIMENKYDTVVNCVGILNQDAERNHAKAVLINGYLPQYLAEITENMDTQIVHMSTDCIFSGKQGGYTEDSIPDGTMFYDRSKAIGELNDNKNITLRTSVIGPDIDRDGIGLLNWFMQQGNSVNGFRGAIWTGQTTLQLAKTMEEAAKVRAHGLYNMVPNESINKFELLKLFNKYIRRDPIEITPADQFAADKSLIRTRYEGFGYQIPDYDAMMKELGVWMRKHKTIYPHYNL